MSVPWLESFRTAVEEMRPLVISLATVDAAGHPQVRSVICRRISDDGSLWIAGDVRSAKHTQLAHISEAAAVCWIPARREQFRFTGGAELIGESFAVPERAELWQAMTPESRAMFSWPNPGEPRHESDVAFKRYDDSPVPPASFELIVLRPEMVEQLRLSTFPHDRQRWTRSSGWRREHLNP